MAGAVTPDQWTSWAVFDTAVDKLVAAGISQVSLNACVEFIKYMTSPKLLQEL
jgi:hypothetical protein